MTDPSRTAVVFAGGVAKGAFEAGALEVLVDGGVRMSQVVGASSGALNATMLAAGVRADRLADAARRLVDLWRDDADWMHVFHLSLRDVLARTGVSDSKDILALMRRELPRIATAAVNPVGLRIVVAALRGVERTLDGGPVTTFEGVLSFSDGDFDDDAGRERIYNAAAASSAFPLLFHPVDVPGLGPCYDGGAVNNTPVKLATIGGADHVFLISPYPAVVESAQEPRGVELAARLVDILIQERVFRDLRDAYTTNAAIARLDGLVADGALAADQLETVLRTLDIKPIRLVTVRPEAELAGNAFSGFIHRDLREQYIAAGQAAARTALAALQPTA
ncbi:MAG: Patatin [bacterium]|nr:Patatin [bacterium]